jgi:type I restriction enzyme S subunit
MTSDHAGGTVGDFVTLQRGTTYRGDLVGHPGPALLGLGSIVPGGGFRPDFKTFGGECPPKLMLGPGDVYVALKGATKDGSMVGSVARVPFTLSAGRLTQDTARLDFSSKDPDLISHVYWVLRTPQYRQYCNGRVTGSASASFSRDDFLAYPVPPMTTASRKLVSVLEATEAKIDLNRQANETLEAMARTLFRSWFVDFDPVRAKADDTKPPGINAETAAVFPNKFEDSALGKIPKGWHTEPLDEIAHFLNGLALQKYPASDGQPFLPVIKIAQLRAGSAENADRAGLDVPEPFVIQDGDLLFSWSGSLEVRVWSGGRGALNQHLFKVTSTRFPMWFVYHWLLEHLPDFQAIAAAKATTMGHIQRHHLHAAKAVVPSTDALKAASKIMEPCAERCLANDLESRALSEMRDTLLPKLLSGELRVPNTERTVEAAT